MVTRTELEDLRKQQLAHQESIGRMARANAVVRRIQQEWSRGVCLMHGVFRIRMPDQTWLVLSGPEPFEVEYTGSGFLVSDQGYVVTNRHVVAPWLGEDGLEGADRERGHAGVRALHGDVPGCGPIDVPTDGIRRRTDDLDVAVVKLDPALVKDLPVLPMQATAPDVEDQRARSWSVTRPGSRCSARAPTTSSSIRCASSRRR